MQFLLNTDHNLNGSESLLSRLEADVENALERHLSRITRIEMHLGDENAGKSGVDKRCQIEARLAGAAPVSVHHVAETVRQAVDGALGKMDRALEHRIGKRDAPAQRGAGPHHGEAVMPDAPLAGENDDGRPAPADR